MKTQLKSIGSALSGGVRTMCAAVGLALCAAGSAQAGVIPLVNGGFESGDLTGWTLNPADPFTFVFCPGPGPAVAEGNCALFAGSVGSLDFLSQSFAAMLNDRINITFAWSPDGGTTSEFSVELDGVTLFDRVNAAAAPYQFVTVHGSANPTAGMSTLSFNLRDDSGFVLLDAVSATAPEPATLGLMGIALAGLGFRRRKTLR